MWARSRLFHLNFNNLIWAGRRRRRRWSGLRRGRNHSCRSFKLRCLILIKLFKCLNNEAFDSIITRWLNFTSFIKCRNDNFFELGSWLGCWFLRLGRWFIFSLGLCRFLGILGLFFRICFSDFGGIRLIVIFVFSILGFLGFFFFLFFFSSFLLLSIHNFLELVHHSF